MINKIKLPDNHTLRFEPYIVPVSLERYKKLFINNEAPFFMTNFLSDLGEQLL